MSEDAPGRFNGTGTPVIQTPQKQLLRGDRLAQGIRQPVSPGDMREHNRRRL
jgi:hypothetical protein